MRSHFPFVALVCGVLASFSFAQAQAEELPASVDATSAPALPNSPESRPAFKGIKTSSVDLNLDYHLRITGNTMGNAADLGKTRDLNGDGKKEPDEVSYLSYIWDVRLDLKYRDFLEYSMCVTSDGPLDFAAPVVGTRDLNTIFGTVDYYRKEELLPKIQEYWVDLFNPKWPVGVKAGLFRYDLGNGFAAPGYYPNYGVNLHGTTPLGVWTLHYHRPDLDRAVRTGPRNRQEEALLAGDSRVDAHYLAADTQIKAAKWLALQPYVTALIDNTAADRRLPVAGAPGTYDRDILGTAGADFNVQVGKWSAGFEGATNFGRAEGTGGTPDIRHCGWMSFVDLAYVYNETLTPRAKAFYLSGQHHSAAELARGDIYHGKNSEFSVYSPTNAFALFDTQYPGTVGPVVATAGGTALNFGVLRPTAAGDPYVKTNLSAFDLGLDWKPRPKLCTSTDFWLLRSNEPGYGAWNGATRRLLHYLGAELDNNTCYQITPRVAVSLLSGVFLPGSYYRQKRDDAPIYSYTARTDGHASAAYQFELSFDIKF